MVAEVNEHLGIPAIYGRWEKWPLTCRGWQVYPQNFLWIDLPYMACQRSVEWPAEPCRSTVGFGSSEHFFQPLLSHLQNMAGQPSLLGSESIHENNFVKQPASLGRSTVTFGNSNFNLPASAGQPSLLGVENGSVSNLQNMAGLPSL